MSSSPSEELVLLQVPDELGRRLNAWLAGEAEKDVRLDVALGSGVCCATLDITPVAMRLTLSRLRVSDIARTQRGRPGCGSTAMYSLRR